MARKRSSGKSEQEKRRLAAIHAKSGDRSEQATRAANSRWEKEYAEYPRYSLADLAEVQARRDAAARERDNKSTSSSVIDPRSDRIHLWVKDPAHHDAKGIDTEIEPDQKPQRPPRPAKSAPRHGDGKPKHAPKPKPGDEAPKAPEKDGQEQPPEAQEPPKPVQKATAAKAKKGDGAVKPKKGDGAVKPKKGKPTKQEDESEKPKEPPRPKVRPPHDDALKVKGFSMDSYVQARTAWDSHARHTHNRAKPPSGSKDALDRLRKMILGKKSKHPGSQAAWEADLSKGGALYDEEGVVGVFDPRAPALGKKAAEKAADQTDGRLQATFPWKKNDTSVLFLDLGAYLKNLDVPDMVNVVPIGNALYSKHYVQAIADAMPGEVLVTNSPDTPMAVRQGDVGVVLAPVLEEDDKQLAALPPVERYATVLGRPPKARKTR